MNQTQRKLFLIFFLVLAVSVGSTTAVISYLIYQGRLASYGDIFDRIALEQIQGWGMLAVFVIFGITLMIILVIIGLGKFYGGNAEKRVRGKRVS
jgi:hypothetical protein